MGLTWDCFVAACNMLGSDRVDFSRLSVTGLSMGGQACWNIARHRGPCLAAAAPVAARCSWNDDSWVKDDFALTSSTPPCVRELVTERRERDLPIRAYCGERDEPSYNFEDLYCLASRRGLPTTPECEVMSVS